MSGGRSWAEIDTDGVEGALDLVGMEVEGRNDPGCGEMAGGSVGGSEVDKVSVCVCGRVCVCVFVQMQWYGGKREAETREEQWLLRSVSLSW